MQRKPGLFAVSILIGLLVFQGMAPDLMAQAPPVPSPQQLEQLLAPVALYPDSLLAQITTASTNPQEILDFDNWLAQNQNLPLAQLTGAAQQQGFDPAFIALAGFPQIVQMMAENIDDYAAIGAAVSANQEEVSAAIQRLRAQAYASGALRSTQQQAVDVQQYGGQPYYAIQPVNPQVVYVPQYDPTVVYAGSGLNVGLLTFGLGIGITALLVSQPWGWGGWGWNWGSRRIYYNRGPWGGWNGGYRPTNVWYRPRPVMYNHRPGYGGNWGYRPPNYRPPRPVNRPSPSRPGGRPPGFQPSRPGTGPGNRPGNGSGNRPVTGPGNGGRPPGNTRPPGNGGFQPGRPGTGTPGNRPQTRPTTQPAPTTRPAPNMQRPAQQARPQMQRPTSAPRPQQQSRPAPQVRPQPQNRPAGGPQGDGGGGRPGPR